MPLSNTSVRIAKLADKPFKLFDGAGLFLLVNPTGSRLWRLKYRIDGREKLLIIGPYPAVSLAKARERRDEAKAQLADGVDPSERKREEKREAQRSAANTFRQIAEEYVGKQKREGRAPATINKTEWLLDFACPDLGDRPVWEVHPADGLDVLRKVEAR